MKPVAAEPDAPAAGPSNRLQQVWQQLGSDLSGLVRIRRIDQPVVPLLPLDQQYFVRENIKTSLNAARMALLRSEAAVYRESLQQSLDWITEYFDTGSQPVKWAMDEIQALTKINARPELPDISRSLASLDSTSSGVPGP
jgi:uroporphyrin-3 C-methyltransferase